MLVAMLNQQQNALPKRISLAFDDCSTGPAHYEKPLVGALVSIARPTFRVAGRNHHLGGLGATVSQSDAKTLSKAECLSFP
jgi:hypothetical protein